MTEKNHFVDASSKILPLVLVCFFLSGFSGLIYEILWMRMIVKIIGGAPFAVSIVLTVFMGGLGVGSFIASRYIDRIMEPMRLVRIYGILELVIGAYGLVLPLLLMLFRPVYSVIYNQMFPYFMPYTLITFIGCAILLCLPVICMGATLPILCRFYVTSLSHVGTNTGRLYGLNTIGAAAGSLVCGFWLISFLGVRGSLIFAVVINAVIGFSCVYLSYRLKTTSWDKEEPAIPEDGPDVGSGETGPWESPFVTRAALLIFAVSGFCSMAYEVIWTKLLGLIVGPTTYSFTIVLVTFILGLALGSMIFGWLGDRTGKAMQILIVTQIVAALSVLGISQLLGDSQFFFAKIIYHMKDNFVLLNLAKAATLFFFMIFPTLCLGATFPLVGKIYTRSVSKVGSSIGFAYAINTVGAVLGSFCAGFILIPLVGKENGLSLVIALQLVTSLIIGALILIRGRRRVLRLIPLAVPVLMGLVLCVYYPQWNRQVLSFGKYHRFQDIETSIRGSNWVEAFLRGSEIMTRTEDRKLVFYGDGIGGFTTVQEGTEPLGKVHYVMVNGGKADASSRVNRVARPSIHGFDGSEMITSYIRFVRFRWARPSWIMRSVLGSERTLLFHGIKKSLAFTT